MWGGEGSRKLTGQLVALDLQFGEARQFSDRFRELCQIRVFSFSATAYWFRDEFQQEGKSRPQTPYLLQDQNQLRQP